MKGKKMAIIKIDPKLEEKFDVYEIAEKSFVKKTITYILNSNYRKAVNLVDWLKVQIDNPGEDVLKIANEIKSYGDPDFQIIEILRWVKTNLHYYSDQVTWKMPERWQTAQETASIKYLLENGELRIVTKFDEEYDKGFIAGDCEDGAILMYVLARIKGIKANRLALMAGNVYSPNTPTRIGGHCWLSYKPIGMPLNWAFIDWCYWPQTVKIPYRNVFYVQNKIWEYEPANAYYSQLQISNYKNLWFVFNEKIANTQVEYSSKKEER